MNGPGTLSTSGTEVPFTSKTAFASISSELEQACFGTPLPLWPLAPSWDGRGGVCVDAGAFGVTLRATFMLIHQAALLPMSRLPEWDRGGMLSISRKSFWILPVAHLLPL